MSTQEEAAEKRLRLLRQEHERIKFRLETRTLEAEEAANECVFLDLWGGAVPTFFVSWAV